MKTERKITFLTSIDVDIYSEYAGPIERSLREAVTLCSGVH